ncbi:MAG: selenoneine biosynthesis selenosugar synthase SenB [Terriglobia bacterium]
MRIQLICPAPPGSRYGNRIAALRWARLLRQLGHRVKIARGYRGQPCDLLVALHAWHSAEAVLRFHRRHSNRPLVVALTGTDIYRDLYRRQRKEKLLRVLKQSTRLVVLQPLAVKRLPSRLRRKVRVVYQSAASTPGPPRKRRDSFAVCVVGHLRRVKDPLRAAQAARLLPSGSRVRIWQAGSAREPALAPRARAEERRNPRYRWLGALSPAKTRRLIASSHLMVLSSLMEGGANVISEAVVNRVPVLASRVPGNVGLLGARYPGYFPVRNTRALARLLLRTETDRRYYARLKKWCARRARLFRPSRERAAWRKLLTELTRLQPARRR